MVLIFKKFAHKTIKVSYLGVTRKDVFYGGINFIGVIKNYVK